LAIPEARNTAASSQLVIQRAVSMATPRSNGLCFPDWTRQQRSL
jgi:hypothetical protein